MAEATIFTIGHSTHPIDEFISMLKAHGIRKLIDVRTIPKSRRNPQFNGDQLAASLRAQGIRYRRMESLGGLRHPRKDSPNAAWRNASFRGYADYMQTEEFAAAVAQLVERGKTNNAVIMCAEAVPWRCHRSLIGDALLARNVEVLDIMTEKSARPHTLTAFARVEGERVWYPVV
ncbi:DUF488 family protein [Arthrobacter sp. ISL-72]|uniref:DUF488 domain-containing protein n=1 Tax=Arthrobacter sp. ISL-72 TaxID=2819114 RepID=UPI001BEC201E|nr:DUF488 domain-containing protein [Arthrobacter sp. ISL-72]MBT2596742.1 DUF488 domain-containing protein [Arthrobacter sp. ISL-72]